MASPTKTRTVFQLPNKGSWFENIAVRANGTILATRVDVPELWVIDPASGDGSVLVTLPPPLKSLTGITELSPDVFALGAGQYNMSTSTIPDSYGIWIVDLSGDGTPTPREITKIPEAGLINGLTTWDATTVLAADSEFGTLYKIDVSKGSAELAADDELMKSPPGPMQIGINGIKVRDGHLYFTNSMRQTMYRVPLDAATASAAGPVEAVAGGFTQDDFTFADDGTAYVASNITNIILKVVPGSKEGATIAGSPETLEVAGGTACALGRGPDDRQVLYVVTAGGLAMPVKGELTEPAKVVAVELA